MKIYIYIYLCLWIFENAGPMNHRFGWNFVDVKLSVIVNRFWFFPFPFFVFLVNFKWDLLAIHWINSLFFLPTVLNLKTVNAVTEGYHLDMTSILPSLSPNKSRRIEANPIFFGLSLQLVGHQTEVGELDPTPFVFASVGSACTWIAYIEEGKQIHTQIIKVDRIQIYLWEVRSFICMENLGVGISRMCLSEYIGLG